MPTRLTLRLPADAAARLLKLWTDGQLPELAGIGLLYVELVNEDKLDGGTQAPSEDKGITRA